MITRKSESRKQSGLEICVASRFLTGAALLAFLPSAPSAAPPQEKVDLGSAGRYVVLAGSLISNIPGSAITGDIGLSPAAGSFITGFGENEVTGTVFTTPGRSALPRPWEPLRSSREPSWRINRSP